MSLSRGFSSVEIAAGVAVLGSLLAVAVPSFLKNLHASHLVEATEGLGRIQKSAAALSSAGAALSIPAPLTPAVIARGERVVDPPGTWEHPTWKALDFRAAPDGMPHRFSFAVDVLTGTPNELVAHAHADLDGDGITSAFEVRLRAEGGILRPVPGMLVQDELE